MALVDDAVVKVGTGHHYVCDYNATTPVIPPNTKAGLIALANGNDADWEEIGHSSLEDILSVTSEGGEATVLGTLQNPNLRTAYSPRSEALSIILHQADATGLKLYYGANLAPISTGSLFHGVPSQPVPSTKTYLSVFTDGAQVFAFYAAKAEIYRGDDLEVADTESLLGLPLSIKPLQHGTNVWPYAVTPLTPLA